MNVELTKIKGDWQEVADKARTTVGKAELEKKDKIINELAKLIYEDDGSWNMHNKFNEQEIIKYVTEKVE